MEHPECHARHERAIATIPGFFAKLFESPISPERFGALLLDAADASFVNANELQGLCIEGMMSLIRSVLEHRLLTIAESQRIAAIKQALDPLLAESLGLDDAIIQIEILRDLGDGKVPDRVMVEGPMPITMRRGETVLWIFNETRAFRADAAAANATPEAQAPLANAAFLGWSVFDAPASGPAPKGNIGDLVLTNYNLYFLTRAGRVARSPIARISDLQPYAGGVTVQVNQAAMTYILGDAWFLANALARLTKLIRRRTPE